MDGSRATTLQYPHDSESNATDFAIKRLWGYEENLVVQVNWPLHVFDDGKILDTLSGFSSSLSLLAIYEDVCRYN